MQEQPASGMIWELFQVVMCSELSIQVCPIRVVRPGTVGGCTSSSIDGDKGDDAS